MLQLTRRRRQTIALAIAGLALLFVGLSLWVASGSPTTADICDKASGAQGEECASYNIIWVALWYIAKLLDVSAPALTAIATAFVGWFTYTLWEANRLASQHTRTIERAYVKMSHAPPGLECLDNGFRLTIGLKNYGTTPAQITTYVLKLHILPDGQLLPSDPDYSEAKLSRVTGAFLVPNDEIFYTNIILTTESPIDIINDQKRHIWVYGYVDYIDQFDVRGMPQILLK
jgi:hypothetical protein